MPDDVVVPGTPAQVRGRTSLHHIIKQLAHSCVHALLVPAGAPTKAPAEISITHAKYACMGADGLLRFFDIYGRVLPKSNRHSLECVDL